MNDAPKRIWAGNDGYANRLDWEYPVDGWDEYHLARPGQPCTTDEFLERLQVSDIDPCQWHEAIYDWSRGDFQAALDAIEGLNA